MTYTLEEVSVRVVSGLLGLAAGALLLVPTGIAPANAAPLTLGAKDIGGDWYRGEMDDATLWVG
jgi:hypothetical protein